MLAITFYIPCSIRSYKDSFSATYLKTKKKAQIFFYELKSILNEFLTSAYKYWHALDGLILRIASDAISKRYLFVSGLLKDFSRSVYQRYLRCKVDYLYAENQRLKSDQKTLFEKLQFSIEQSDKDRTTKTWALGAVKQAIEKHVIAFQQCKEHHEALKRIKLQNDVLMQENARLKKILGRVELAKEIKRNEDINFPDLSGLKVLLEKNSLDPLTADILLNQKLPSIKKQLSFYITKIGEVHDKMQPDAPSYELINEAQFLLSDQLGFFDAMIDALTNLKLTDIQKPEPKIVDISQAVFLLKQTLKKSEVGNL